MSTSNTIYKCLRTYQPPYKSIIENTPFSNILEKENYLTIKAEFSSLNYKDALAVTGRSKILKSFPLIAGIDVAGETVSQNSELHGQKVLITGCGLGENYDGGFSQYVSFPAEWCIPIPSPMTTFESMALGTAGFTAALSVHRILENHQTPEMGPIVVTGSSGGVGSFAVSILSQIGFEVWAITSKKENHVFLEGLGASKIMTLKELDLGSKPLESVKFAGAIDNLGGETLEGLIRHTELWGNIACIGLAQGHSFNSTVMPHILRGVSLLGISSANCPLKLRKEIWEKLAGPWKPKQLNNIVKRTIGLDDIVSCSEEMLDNQLSGRTVISLAIPQA